MTKLDLPAEVVEAHLAELHARFRSRDANALFKAIGFCGNQQIAMPEWVVAAYFAAMNRWWSYECATLDAAFGIQWPKGKHLAAARKRRKLEFAVLQGVKDRIREGASITPALFAAVGKTHGIGIGKTLAEKYYRHALKMTESMPAAAQLLLDPFMTAEARKKQATRKISKLSGSRSKSK